MKARRNRKTHSLKRGLVTLLALLMVLSVCFPGLSARATEDTGEESHVVGESTEATDNNVEKVSEKSDVIGAESNTKTILETDTVLNNEIGTITGIEISTVDSSEAGAKTDTETTGESENVNAIEAENEQDSAVEELYIRLMSTTTYDELSDMMDSMTDEEWILRSQFTEEQESALTTHVQKLMSDSGASVGETLVDETSQYYHLDFRIAATVTIKVLNADGTITSVPVTGTISNPGATIYNTGSKTWSSHNWVKTDSTTNYKYFDVNFKSNTSSDNGAYEYMMDPGKTPGRQEAEFYNGDTVVLTYTLKYTYNGKTYTLNNLTQTIVLTESANQCNSREENGTKRGFDVVVSTENITTAMSTSQLQITKYWEDSGNNKRPGSITVKVYQKVNSVESHYMTLVLTASGEKSYYEMADGFTADTDMKVVYAANYGVTITGLPQNHWIKNSDGTYTYESCSYTVKEVQASGDANINAVYGSFVYVDDTKADSYIVTITNTLAYEKLAVYKEWSDGADAHTNDSVEVKLSATYEGGTVPDAWLADFLGGSTTFTLSAANNWNTVMGNMPVYYIDVEGNNYPITGFNIVETSIKLNGTNYTGTEGENALANSGYSWTVTSISKEKDSNGNYYFTVTNSDAPKTGDLKINKTVDNVLFTSGDETFTFKVTPASEIDLTEWAEANEYTLNTDGTLNVSITVTAPAVSGSVSLEGLPLGSYTVEEIDVNNKYETVAAQTVEVTADATAIAEATITNTLKRGSLDVTKTVSGNLGNQSESFEFTAVLKYDDTVISMEGVTVQKGEAATTTLGAVDKYVFNLTHGETITFDNLPYGAKLTVTETSTDTYVEYVAVDALVTDETPEGYEASATVGTNQSINFTNDYDVVIDTGITTISYPFILLLSTAIVGAFVLLLCKRRQMEF